MNQIIQGDCLEVLKTIHSESVDCVITSPPYYGLRDYGTAKWEGGDIECNHNPQKPDGGQMEDRVLHLGRGGIYKDICKCGAIRIDAQIGLEKTPEEYVAKMVEVFREVKRVLKKEAILWLNMGDSYTSTAQGTMNAPSTKIHHGEASLARANYRPFTGLKPKDLVGIPWRVAFALQADGWYLRQDIIWHKPNPMPESVTDRCTKSHEYVFLLSKNPKYYYDAEAIKEPHADTTYTRERYKYNPSKGNYSVKNNPDTNWKGGELSKEFPTTRNKRSVWTITTKPFSEAHFATFPEDLVEPMIKAGTSEKGVCPDCGKAWVRIIENTDATKQRTMCGGMKGHGGKLQEWRDEHPIKTLGWKPSCSCDKNPIPAVVLDPFAGSGTALVVAKRLGRGYLGIELNPEYVKIANNSLICMRNRDEMKTLKEIDNGKQKTIGLFKV